MNIGKVFANSRPLLLAFALLLTSHLFSKKTERPFLSITKQDTSININENLLSKVNLGLKRLLSSSLWIATILESDVDHYKNRDLNSWMFLRFNSISILDPLFYENYLFGGTYLSIVKDDLSGASILYRKGLKQYPSDFQLLKNAGYHFYFEMGNTDEAYPIYKKLKETNTKNPMIINTYSRMVASKGNLSDAFEFLTDIQKQHDANSFIGKKIYEHRYAIKAEIDLSCLNEQKNNCDTIDLDGRSYLKTAKGYMAMRGWTPYRTKLKKKFN